MYDTHNEGFIAAACSPNREIRTYAILHSNAIAIADEYSIISYKVTYASMAGKSFTPGNFVATQLELSLTTASATISGIDFKTTPVRYIDLYAGIKVNGTNVPVPMGTFYPDQNGVTVSDNGKVVIKCTDIPEILKTQFDSSNMSLPCTIEDALTQISTDTGISILYNPSDFPNIAVTLTESFNLITTYREALMYIAETLGAFVHMSREGEIHLKKCFSGVIDLGCTLDESYLFSVKKQESSVKSFQYISIKANENDIGVTQEIENVGTECTYTILDNPLTYGHPEDFLGGLVSPTSFPEFYPSIISFQGRPDIDVGDVVTYSYKGKTYLLPICNHVFEYKGGYKTTIESVGTDKLNTSSVDAGIKAKITAIKQNINSLIRDLNQTQSKIVDIDGEISRISTILQTVDTLSSQISRIEGDVENLSTLTQTAEQLRIDLSTAINSINDVKDTVDTNQNTLLSYFDFQADGLTIGVNNSNIKLKLSHNKIYFVKDNTDIAYFSDGQLYVTDAQFLRSLILGKFEFTPRANGNLSLMYRG